MYFAANKYFCHVRAHISLFVHVPLSPVFLYVNLRIPVCMYVNLHGFGPRMRICSFVQMPFFPVCISLNLRGFGPRLSVCVPLYPVRRGLILYPNTRAHACPEVLTPLKTEKWTHHPHGAVVTDTEDSDLDS